MMTPAELDGVATACMVGPAVLMAVLSLVAADWLLRTALPARRMARNKARRRARLTRR